MRYAYADPPYLGCGKLYKQHHDEAMIWDTPKAHQDLIASLLVYDGWAMSLSTPSLKTILPMCPDDCRVAAWVKPFAVFRPNVNPAYAWEPVIFRGSARRGRYDPTIRDWVSANITMQKGLPGAKPAAFAEWILRLLGVTPWDEFVDLFPGTGIVGKTFEEERQLFREKR